MFNDLVNLHDFVVLAERVRRNGAVDVLFGLFGEEGKRVERSWRHTSSPPTNWWDIPDVQKRWNSLISGNSAVDSHRYISKKYFAKRRTLRGISLGCGSGERELRWAKASRNLLIDAYDRSAERIAQAVTNAEKGKLSGRVKFHVADVHTLDLAASTYDVVFTEGSLHHFSPVNSILEKISHWLKPGGLFIVNEYVGPSRFQWTKKQLEIVNSVLGTLPERFKTTYRSNAIKRKVYRPGRLSMWLSDPSEAAESSSIVSLLQSKFKIVEFKEYGGAILQLLFKDIAQNFRTEDAETKRLLQYCFEAEDVSMERKEIASDFIFAVCRKRGAAARKK